MVGVCAAWHLQKRGYNVTILDRKAPGEETSWGNAGIIQRECLKPYPFPSGFFSRVKMALNLKTDVRYDVSSLPQNLYAIWVYWRSSHPRIYNDTCNAFASLIVHCTSEHDVMIKASNSNDLIRRLGFVELFRTKSMSEIEREAEEQRATGVEVQALSANDVAQLEPSLNVDEFTGGFFFKQAWQVADPGALVKAYAKSFVSHGGSIIQASVTDLYPMKNEEVNGWTVSTNCGDFEAPAVVVATGPWTNDILKNLGYSFPMILLRGYSTHFTLTNGANLRRSIVDLENGFVLGPMLSGVRLTTGGEVSSLNAPPNDIQLSVSKKLASQILPLGRQVDSVWYGHRPLIADMKPVIGESPIHSGLWMCFGHGYQGFTLGPISGRLIAEMMSEEQPVVNPSPFSVDRFFS